MRNKKIILAVWVSSLLLLLVFWKITYNNNYDLLQIEYNGSELYFFYDLSANLYINEETIQINSFYNQKENTYYLMLPNGFKANRTSLLLFGADDFTIDEKKYATDSKLDFMRTGLYILQFGDKSYKLRVIRESELPSVMMVTSKHTHIFLDEDKENIDTGFVNIYDKDGKLITQNTINGIHSRGNSSFVDTSKKSYSVTLDTSLSLFEGFSSKRYLLIANALDPSYIRNKLVYDLGNDADMPYTPKSQFCNLYMNGDYMGLYLLVSPISYKTVRIHDLEDETKILNELPLDQYVNSVYKDKNNNLRKAFDIPKNPADITGGYIVEQEASERFNDEACGFITNYGRPITIKLPKYASVEQLDYISDFINKVEYTIVQKDEKRLNEIIDLNSWVKRYLIEEITKNNDFGITSQYFYKPRGEQKLYAGPIWDYDSALGRVEGTRYGSELESPKGLNVLDYHNQSPYIQWFYYLYETPLFYESMIDCYENIFVPNIENIIEKDFNIYKEELSTSVDADCMRWDKQNTFENELENVKEFLEKRMLFFTDIWLSKENIQ